MRVVGHILHVGDESIYDTYIYQESTQDGQRCKDNIRVAHKEIGV